ncbi:MAG: transposase, partial [Actinobacteria bacterium]|nr:transposase [Actinomycetota bacterium]
MEMLDMRQKKAITKELRDRYNRATKKKKGLMLDEFCAITGYNRSYASSILKIKKDKVLGYVKTGGKTI